MTDDRSKVEDDLDEALEETFPGAYLRKRSAAHVR
jgi:hypothetical protein